MSTVYSGSWLDKVVLAPQTDARTMPNAGGTWTNTNATLVRHSALSLTQVNPITTTPYKTGTRSTLIGVRGRRAGSFSLSMPLVPNAAGVVPDADLILKSVFGQAAVIVTSTSATYSFLDNGMIPFALLRYNKSGGTSPTNFLAGGCIPQTLTIQLGGEYLTMTVEGKCVYVADSTQFSSYTGVDAVAAFGLTTWPAEPSGLTANGTLINGFGGTATFDSNPQTDLRGTPSIVIHTGLDFAEDGFADGYPFAITGGRRSVSISTLHFIDNDGSALNNLKVKAGSKSAINIAIQVNSTAGSIVTVNLKSVQLGPHALVENGNAFDVNFGDGIAHATAAANVDDVNIVFT